jgi:hypothetical protein
MQRLLQARLNLEGLNARTDDDKKDTHSGDDGSSKREHFWTELILDLSRGDPASYEVVRWGFTALDALRCLRKQAILKLESVRDSLNDKIFAAALQGCPVDELRNSCTRIQEQLDLLTGQGQEESTGTGDSERDGKLTSFFTRLGWSIKET